MFVNGDLIVSGVFTTASGLAFATQTAGLGSVFHGINTSGNQMDFRVGGGSNVPLKLTTAQILANNNGAVGTPSFTWFNNQDTGLYYVPGATADADGFFGAVNGVLTFGVASGTFQVRSRQFATEDGDSGTPGMAFRGDLDTGIFRVGANDLAITAGGTKIVDFYNNQIATIDGSAGVPSYGFYAAGNIGMFRAGTNILGFSVSGVEAMRLGYNGRLAIGVADTTSFGLYVFGNGGVRIENGALQLDIGSAGVPTYTFGEDLDTGLFRQAADALGISTGTVEVLRCDADSTAGQTRSFLFNNTAGTLKRVAFKAFSTLAAGDNVLYLVA